MQPLLDPLAIPRRAMDVEDYLDVLRRHRAWILGPAFAGLVISFIVAFLWPDTYVSKATIKVAPPMIPERYVPNNVTQEMNQRINAMLQNVESRATLTNIIQTHQLYQRERKRLPMEDVIELMKSRIRVGRVGNLDQTGRQQLIGFTVEFAYENRLAAQKVCQELVTRFIDENIRVRSEMVISTNEYLKDELDKKRRELDEINSKIASFKAQNLGNLPDDRIAMIGALSNAEQRISNANSMMSRVQQDKQMLQTQLQNLKDRLRVAQNSPMRGEPAMEARNDQLRAVEQQISQAETQLTALREQYTDTYPTIRSLLSSIDALKKQRVRLQDEDEKMRAEASKKVEERRAQDALSNRELSEIEGQIRSVQTAIAARDLEVQDRQREINAAVSQRGAYQSSLQTMPAGEREYQQLMLDRGLIVSKYDELSKQQQESNRSATIEQRKQGETLDVLDPASLPQQPTEPNRWIIVGAGTGLGALLGLFMAGGREMKDNTLKNLKDVRAYTQLTVLGSLPLLENDLVVRRRRRLAWLAWSTACLTGILAMAGVVVYYLNTKS
jgi:polysaccharide chain length determinant protein (PEP-CTERM system associated)